MNIAVRTNRELADVYKEAFEQVYLSSEAINAFSNALSSICEITIKVNSLEVSTGTLLSVEQYPHLAELKNKDEDKYVNLCSIAFRRESFDNEGFDNLMEVIGTDGGELYLKPFSALMGKAWNLKWIGYDYIDISGSSHMRFIF